LNFFYGKGMAFLLCFVIAFPFLFTGALVVINNQSVNREDIETISFGEQDGFSDALALVAQEENIIISQKVEEQPKKTDENKEEKKDETYLLASRSGVERPEPEKKEKTTKEQKQEKEKTAPKSDDDLYWLSRIIHAEARGEPYEGKVAVGAVVLNRAKKNNKTIKQVIFASGQFTPVKNGSIYNKPSAESIQAAKDALAGVNPVGDAYYFYNPKISKSKFMRSRKLVKRIGNHDFLK